MVLLHWLLHRRERTASNLLLFLFVISALLSFWGGASSILGSKSPLKTGEVFILDDSNFQKYLSDEPTVLLLFYAPWCHWCRELLPKYQEAARLASQGNLPIKFAQIDATSNAKAAETYSIDAYPTIKLFFDGESHDYTGGREKAQIFKWVTERLQTDILVKTSGQLDALLTEHRGQIIAIGHFDDPDGANKKAFTFASRKLDHAVFAEVYDELLLQRLVQVHQAPSAVKDLANFVLVYNPHASLSPNDQVPDEPRVVLYPGPLDNDLKLTEFLKTYAFPVLATFEASIAPRAFSDGRPVLVLFSDSGKEQDARTANVLKVVKAAAKKRRGKIIFLHSQGLGVVDARLAHLLAAEEDPKPTLRLFAGNPIGHGNWQPLTKYKPSDAFLDNPSLEYLEDWLENYARGSLQPYHKTEPIPSREDNPGPVYTLVAASFDEEVLRAEKDVVVDLYAPWCGHCRKLEPVLRQVAEALRDNKHIKIAKMDVTRNEISLSLTGYPTIALYKPKTEKPLIFHGERTLDGIVNWIARYGSKKFNAANVIRAYERSKQRNAAPTQGGSALLGDLLSDEL